MAERGRSWLFIRSRGLQGENNAFYWKPGKEISLLKRNRVLKMRLTENLAHEIDYIVAINRNETKAEVTSAFPQSFSDTCCNRKRKPYLLPLRFVDGSIVGKTSYCNLKFKSFSSASSKSATSEMKFKNYWHYFIIKPL